MRAFVNDALRFVIAHAIKLLGVVMDLRQGIRIRRFRANQRYLKRKYRLHGDTPVVSYGPRVIESIRHAAAHAGRDATFAMTSGSTGEPKKILYTKRRLRTLKLTFSDMFARTCRAYRLERTTLYVFSSFQRDASLTSMLLNEPKLPLYLSTLQAPYRLQQHAAIRELAAEYGANAVRLWVLTMANPGVLYATNPSTISTFLDELKNNWTVCSTLIKDWHRRPQRFDRTVHAIARRLDSRGSAERLRRVASSTSPVPLEQFAPAVRAYICWTGGYVKPFLYRLAVHLPPSRYRPVPMYSMSTETLETETVFRDAGIYFLPLANGVVYEFIHAESNDSPEKLVNPDELTAGETYVMVVSDSYGLRRYQTGDLFECRGRAINGLPDLAFLRRCGLEYSFAGEKVTADQLNEVFNHLRARHPVILSHEFLTCVPSLPPDERPHYKFILIRDSDTPLHANSISTHADELLSEMNCEYKHKRATGLLGPIRFAQLNAVEFAKRFAGSWETQFKFLPLYQRTWESTAVPAFVPHVNASHFLVSHIDTGQHTQPPSLR